MKRPFSFLLILFLLLTVMPVSYADRPLETSVYELYSVEFQFAGPGNRLCFLSRFLRPVLQEGRFGFRKPDGRVHQVRVFQHREDLQDHPEVRPDGIFCAGDSDGGW